MGIVKLEFKIVHISIRRYRVKVSVSSFSEIPEDEYILENCCLTVSL